MAATTNPAFLKRFGEVVDLTGLGSDAAAEALRAVGIDGITCLSDVAIERTAELAEALGLRYHSASSAIKLADKFEQRAALRHKGFRRPEFRRLDGDLDIPTLVRQCADFSFPAVCKPVRGMSSIDVARVANLEELSAHLAEIWARGAARTMILETEFVGVACEPGTPNFVSVECAVVDGAVEVLGVRGKMDQSGFRSTGAMMPAHLDEATTAAIATCAIRAAQACETTYGVLHIEIKVTTDGPEVIEVNGRVGGRGVPELVRRQVGVDLHALACEIALGIETDRADLTGHAPVSYFFRLQPPLHTRARLERSAVDAFAARFGVDEVTVDHVESFGHDHAGTLADSLMTIEGNVASHEQALEIYSALQDLPRLVDDALTPSGDRDPTSTPYAGRV